MGYREINNLFLYEFLKNFALSLIGVFIPVYIVSEGFGLLPAGLFIVLSGITGVVLSQPLSQIISKIGFKHSLVASYIFIVPGLLVIRYLELSIAVICVSSILYNIGRILHNISLNSEFAVDSLQKNRETDSGKMLSLPSISRIIAPFVGGAVFAGLGFGSLFLLTVLILLLSIIPLLRSTEHRDPLEYNISALINEEILKTVPMFVIRGIQGVTAVDIFGLFVFMIVGGSIDVGAARALDSLGFVITGLLVGRYAVKLDSRIFVSIGCLGASAMYFLRGFLVTPLQVFLVSFFGGIFFQIYHVPIYSGFANEAEDTEVLEFYTLRKIFVALGNIISVGTLGLFFILYDLRTGFLASFSLGGIATLIMAVLYWENSLE